MSHTGYAAFDTTIEKTNQVLKDIEEGVLRVRTIVSDLRSFSHHENEQIDEVPLADVVTSSLRFHNPIDSKPSRLFLRLTGVIAPKSPLSGTANGALPRLAPPNL